MIKLCQSIEHFGFIIHIYIHEEQILVLFAQLLLFIKEFSHLLAVKDIEKIHHLVFPF